MHCWILLNLHNVCKMFVTVTGTWGSSMNVLNSAVTATVRYLSASPSLVSRPSPCGQGAWPLKRALASLRPWGRLRRKLASAVPTSPSPVGHIPVTASNCNGRRGCGAPEYAGAPKYAEPQHPVHTRHSKV